MNNDNPYAAQFMASMNNPQPMSAVPKAKADPRKLIMIIGLALVVIFSIVVILVTQANNSAREKIVHTGISVMLVPLNAKAEINGKEYVNGTYYFKPGKYKAHITADGFTESDVEFEVSEAKLTTVATYLRPGSKNYSDEDIDLLRFLSDDDETNAFIENRLLEKKDILFASYENGIMSIDDVPLSDQYVGNSKKMVAETVSAYFYYAHPEIEKIASIDNPDDGHTFHIIIDDDQKYAVNYLADKDESIKTSDVYNISYVSIQKWGSDDELFWYDGSFSYGEVLEPFTYDATDPSFD